jgi:hypothetical protein
MLARKSIVALLLGFSLGAAGLCQAGSGPTFVLPMAGSKPKSGLRLVLDGRGVDATGYRPIRIEIRPLSGTPLPADRQLRIVLRPTGYNNTAAGLPEVSQIVELPEGQTVVTTNIAVPQLSSWSMISVTTYEGGQKLGDLSIGGIGWSTTGYWDWTEARPAILVIDTDVPSSSRRAAMLGVFRSQGSDPNPVYKLPEVTILGNLFPDPNRGGPTYFPGNARASDLVLLSQVEQMQRLEMLPPAELPDRWIDLSQYDVAMISLGDLKSMAKSHPQKFAALAAWAASGPLLVVYDVGADFERLAELEKLLALPALPADDDAARRGWTPADNSRHLPTLEMLNNPYVQQNMPTYGPYGYAVKTATVDPLDSLTNDTKPLPAPEEPPFLLRPCGMGTLVAISADQPFPGSEDDWKWIFNCVPRNHWLWFQRNGFSLHRANSDYWSFLIPGVGQAPVLSFLLLVTLFAVIIGPLNYMFLSRVRRLYLLLVTVPAGALLITLALFGYAVVTDGLGVRLRARSYTDLDQRTGRAVAWSRQTYYASIAPSRGLSFPDDCTVYPILDEPDIRPGSNPPRQVLAWSDEQNLRVGYVHSRTQAQFMVERSTHPGEIEEKLMVKEAAGSPPRATNELGWAIRYVLLRESKGGYFFAENLGAGKSQDLKPATPATAEVELEQLFGANPLEPPQHLDPTGYNSLLSEMMPNYSWSAVDSGMSMPIMATSLLETNLALATRPTLHPPAPGTYIAVMERSPVVPYGVSRVRQQASFHILRGRY